MTYIDKEQQDKIRKECSKEIEDLEKSSSMSCLKWPFLVFLSFLCLFIFAICSESESFWLTFLSVVSAIIAILSLLVIIFGACIISVGHAVGASRTYPKVAWKDARSYNRTEEEWNSLSKKEKEHRIGCIETILSDCGSVYERADIINFLKGDNSKIRISV